MNKIIFALAFLFIIIAVSTIPAQTKTDNKKENAAKTEKKDSGVLSGAANGKGFVDKNGDGYNDNAPDDDGDGIPNCIDPDYKGGHMMMGKKGFTDKNGDGINDNAGKGKMGKGMGKGMGVGTGMGSGTGMGNQRGMMKGKMGK